MNALYITEQIHQKVEKGYAMLEWHKLCLSFKSIVQPIISKEYILNILMLGSRILLRLPFHFVTCFALVVKR